MSDYVQDVAVHIAQLLTEMLEARRIKPSRLQRVFGLLERGMSRARARGDRHLMEVFRHCLTGMHRQPLHQMTDRQLEAVVRIMQLIADGGHIGDDDEAQAVSLLTAAGLSVGAAAE